MATPSDAGYPRASTGTEPSASVEQGASKGIEILARAGYVAKGVVYGVVGILATLVAFGYGGATTDSSGAVRAIGRQPFGEVLLWLVAAGLVGYVCWRVVQAVKDTERKGTDLKGLAIRAGYLASAVTYGLLAVLAARVALGSGGGGNGSTESWTAWLMSIPFGVWLVGILGLIVLGVGLHHFKRSHTESFMSDYQLGRMSTTERTWARRLGKWGLAARGVTFSIIGVFLMVAAYQADPSEAKGLDQALSTLARQPYGMVLLGVVAVGLVAYGVYCFSRARYRHFQTS